jgi:hypothetical protein
MIVDACKRGDTVQLQQWGQQGVRVSSGMPLVHTAAWGFVNLIQCLVKELGANVDTEFKGYAPLHCIREGTRGCYAVPGQRIRR